jgi:holo-[acyl-carrier protein] synthase
MTVLGLGIDIVDVERFALAMSRRARLAERLFSEEERRITRGKPERLAARFAAKEATWKSLGVGLGATAFKDVEVRRHRSGAPDLVLHGRAAELASALGATRFHITMTHTALSAAAVVVMEGA